MNMHLISVPYIIIGAVVLLTVSTDLTQCQHQQQQQIQQKQVPHASADVQQNAATHVPPTRYNWRGAYRQSASTNLGSNNNICEYKELMKNLQDRVSVLATLDEDQRLRLESIDKKLERLETSNQARMESLSAQQMDFLNRLDSLEHVQRLSKHTLDELKGETDSIEVIKKLRKRKSKKLFNKANDNSLARATRQASPSLIDEIFVTNNTQPLQPDISRKLDALAIFLTSTQIAISDLQTNVTKLLQQTGNLQKRLSTVLRRKQPSLQYGPPAPRQPSYYATNGPEQQLITSCSQDAPIVNNILKLQLTQSSEPFYVICETEDIYNGDWTVILKRFNGAVNFRRDWLEYKAGFGNLAGEFFIGLEKLHALTASAVHELLVILEDFEGVKSYAKYSHFAITGEDEQYALHLLGAYEGDAGDSLVYHAGSKFSTFDHDNDGCLDCNCAQSRGGGWWYNWCATSNLMGQYYNTANYSTNDETVNGIFWDRFRKQQESLKKVKMMIRPAGEDYLERRRR